MNAFGSQTNNIKSLIDYLSNNLPFISSFSSIFRLDSIKAKVLRLYIEVLSNENLSEEAFFDYLEQSFINALYRLKERCRKALFLKIFCSLFKSRMAEAILQLSVSLITPDEFGDELRKSLKATVRKAYQSFLAKERLLNDKLLQAKISIRLKSLVK